MLSSVPDYIFHYKNGDIENRLKDGININNSNKFKVYDYYSSALLNKQKGEDVGIAHDQKLGMEYAEIACDGLGPGLGIASSCKRLQTIYTRGIWI